MLINSTISSNSKFCTKNTYRCKVIRIFEIISCTGPRNFKIFELNTQTNWTSSVGLHETLVTVWMHQSLPAPPCIASEYSPVASTVSTNTRESLRILVLRRYIIFLCLFTSQDISIFGRLFQKRSPWRKECVQARPLNCWKSTKT